MRDLINDRIVEKHPKDQGITVDFADVSAMRPVDIDGQELGFWDDREPAVISFFDPAMRDTDDPDYAVNGLRIKAPNSTHVAVPDLYSGFLPMIVAGCEDYIKLRGLDAFKSDQIAMVVKRTDVEPGNAHRNEFSGWHQHMGLNLRMLYLFHDVLGTEYKIKQHEGKSIEDANVIAPDYSVTRMPPHIWHRSQHNTSEETVRRVWGAILFEKGNRPARRSDNGLPSNPCLITTDNPWFEAFETRGKEALEQGANLHRVGLPRPLVDYYAPKLEI